jgi:alpha-methylacyl-CoA racemase
VAPVLTLAEAPAHAHNAKRNSYAEIAGVTVAAPTPRFDRTPTSAAPQPPEIGADTEVVLSELGYTETEQAALRKAGVTGP